MRLKMSDALIVQLMIFGTVALIGLLALLLALHQREEVTK